jgi:hypothetical protein
MVAHRATRVTLAGSIRSERDRQEFQRMVNEKQAAFTLGYGEMALFGTDTPYGGIEREASL